MKGHPRLATSLFLAFFLMLFFALSASVLSLGVTADGQAVATPGSGWELQAQADYTAFYGVDAVDSSTAWAVGFSTLGKGVICKTVNGGATWTEQQSGVSGMNYQLTGVSAVDALTAYVVGQNVVLKTIDGGTTWTKIYQSDSVHPFRVLALDTDNVWVIGFMGTNATDGVGFIAKSADGGVSWSLQYSLPGKYFADISAAGAGVLWAVGGSLDTGAGVAKGGVVLNSTDGGGTWHTQVSYESAIFTGVSAVDLETVWVVAINGTLPAGTGTIFKTSDGGTSWDPQYSSSSSAPFNVSAVDRDTAWAVGGTPTLLSSTGDVLKTTDGGTTWVSQDLPIACYLSGIEALDPSAAWAVGIQVVSGAPGSRGTIIKTVDGGNAKPDIVSVVPSSGKVGDTVTINGCDFGAGPADIANYVSFGGVKPQSTDYVSWADKQIVVKVPAGVTGKVAVTVTTPAGISNPKNFTVTAQLTLTSIVPSTAGQYSLFLNIAVEGTGFQPGATLKLVKGITSTLDAYNLNVTDTKITGAIILFGAETGPYDVVVENPGGDKATLTGGFNVTSPCGTGSGTALLMLGLSLGLLSLAGSSRLRRRRKEK
jgi:photosystem II stability/assembly factor-like uncharacterized protein